MPNDIYRLYHLEPESNRVFFKAVTVFHHLFVMELLLWMPTSLTCAGNWRPLTG